MSKEQATQTRRLVLIAGLATTLTVWTTLSDPINLPKMFVLMVFSAWILGSVAVSIKYERGWKLPLGQVSVIVFAVGILIAGVLTHVRYTAFFGATQRNDGAFSYLALSTLSIAAMRSFTYIYMEQVRRALFFMGAVLGLYGLLQSTGHDPFHWALVYGPVIGTFGNPDFMSATVGASIVATIWMLFSRKNIWIRLGSILLTLLELYVVRKSGSIQGLVAMTFGVAVILLAKVWQVNRRIGLLALALTGVASVSILLGLGNLGPLASHLYRSSLKNRLDYWHAAFSMFKAHPIFGVGLDRFGDSYGKYAPQIQTVQGQGTDNAHNVFLQLMATGGLVVIVPYLLLITVIFVAAVRAMRNATGEVQLDLIALFTFWAALLLISIISIDNLGVAVWFWISGGVLYGVSHDQSHGPIKPSLGKKKPGRIVQAPISQNSNYMAPIVSFVLAIFVLIALVPIWKTSSALLDLQFNKYGLDKARYIARLDQVANLRPKNVQTLISVSDLSLSISSPGQAQKFARQALEKDPKSLNAHTLSALAYESSKRYRDALPYRLRLLELDPWSTRNMLQLVTDYVELKDLAKAREISSRLSNLYPTSADALAAAALIKG